MATGILSCSQPLQLIWRSAGVWSSDELQWLDFTIGNQDSHSSNGHQGDMPYCINIISKYIPFT